MKAIGVEYVIPMYGDGILAENAAIVRVDDEGGGAYLDIRGRNMNPEKEGDEYAFYLDSEKKIESFCRELKKILEEAQ